MSKKLEWGEYYELLCQVKAKEGTANVHISYVYKNINIGRWLARQRNIYSSGKMTIARQQKLESLNVVWNANDLRAAKRKKEWFKMFRLAETFYKEKGHLRMPNNYLIEGVDVGKWLRNLKSRYLGYGKSKIFPYQVEALESIGIEWYFDFAEEQWESMYKVACEYYNEHGDLGITQDKEYKGYKLGYWVHQQRQVFHKSKLSKEKITKLNAIKIVWYPQTNKWETCFKCAERFYKEVGNLDVPSEFVIDGINLGRWIGVQRQSYHGRKDTILTDEQIERLNSIEMIWEGNANTQTSFYEQIIFYYVKKSFPIAINRYKDLGFEIDVFIPDKRIGIEYDGYYWHKDKEAADTEKNKRCIDEKLNLIRIRECGLSPLPGSVNYILKDNNLESFEMGLSSVFEKYLGCAITPNIKKDAFKIVKGYKLKLNSSWYKAYREAKTYFHAHGNLLVMGDYITPSGFLLGKWIKNQRQHYKGNLPRPLTNEQISLLNDICMVWDAMEYQWQIGYSYAVSYFEEHGHLSMPQKEVYKGFALGKWIFTQRYVFRKSKNYSEEHRNKLDSISMSWDCTKRNFKR